MQVQVKTEAPELSTGELIVTRAADGLSWVLVECKSLFGGSHLMACLCAKRELHQGRKHSVHYEWLSFRCPGKTFADRTAALGYIAAHS